MTGSASAAYNTSVTSNAEIESLIRDLPDPQSARLFLENLINERPRTHQKLLKETGLLSDALALAAYSPLLATTLEQNPDYIPWLARERADTRVRTAEQLRESLARFALTNSSLTPAVLFARFRRRELLRIYLHDVRRAHTLVETTEELSNLADAILDYALSLARQSLDNKYGAPLCDDGHGRIATAEFCVLALGKLGSRELNYASDIDLVFIYSDDGTTAGSGERDKVTNREYFVKLAEAISKLVGQPAGESPAYRVDLRLRPHGRDGALASSLAETLKYYDKTAQAWERQALIRSRAAAGSSQLFSRFAGAVQKYIYRPNVSVKDALASVRLAKQKIDRQVERSASGFNVKLQRGGIREIEFIAQALQLAHGGLDEWLRGAHTLISLGRLADRDLISEQERTQLSEGYEFLRVLEHRLQMEHGLQTHTVPENDGQRTLVARRMGFSGATALMNFNRALALNTTNVRRAYDRVFAESVGEATANPSVFVPDGSAIAREATVIQHTAAVFAAHLNKQTSNSVDAETLAQLLTDTAFQSANSKRALAFTARVAASLTKAEEEIEFSREGLLAFVRLCGASEMFGEMVAANPALLAVLSGPARKLHQRDYRAQLRACVDAEKTFAAELSAFRREWSKLLIEIGAQDAAGEITVAESNHQQTELAIASINVAYLIARRELGRRYGRVDAGPRIAVLALGRLASGGVDYASDLDLIILYDSLVGSPISSLTRDEAYARLCELMMAALSSVTREGYLYRVDLRLRPDGKNGPLVSSSESFLEYLKQRSAVWEWLAYVKLRAVAGDLELGRMIETHARHAVHERAAAMEVSELQRETRHIRERLEKEKTRRRRADAVDIKYGAGGMLDVYFAVRYLQLRDDISDEGEDRSTASTLERLERASSLEADDYAALSEGYELLRAIDHQLRLIVGKVASLPFSDHAESEEIAAKLGFETATALHETLQARMGAIRAAYDRITARAES
ncbi:MAG: [glutamine synthetase] adenylyltransferase / [glutamine synthetase]-adenylyl-L-tyrosine [Pyrinomonadaceae bacterium]|nr:[glutamine synthetase] adenylyltransferase / [glutamine synthetase]-adenylyl-L-tyrosine [Pyrinomonadaceae bacterium]